MDLYSILSLEAFLLVPFVCYFLFFRKNRRSLYSNRDFYYPIKFYLAKNVVRLGQEKSRKCREKHGYKIEPEVKFSSNKQTHYQSFQGCDHKGNSLALKFTLRSAKQAEVSLVLKLANGTVYTFPGSQKVHVTSIKDNLWKLNGLVIENLEPYKRVRIVYNGLLQNVSCTQYEKIEHIQFNFIFNCCSAPKFYPEDVDTTLLAETLAARPWKDASWKEFLDHQSEGYEQFGALLGFIKGDSFPEEQVVNLPACRSKYGGPDERFIFDREIKLFLAETNGVLIKLNFHSFNKKDQSQINYGYICHKNNITVPITAQDIRIEQLGKKGSLPDIFVAHIATKTEEYTCVFNINKSSSSLAESPTGFEIFNVNAECDVNTTQGKSLIEFTYYDPNKIIKTPKHTVLCEVKVDTLPDNFVVNIKDENAKILELTGGKGNSLALLTSLEAKEFIVPDGFVLTVNAFKRQLLGKSILQIIVKNIDDVFCGRKVGKRAEVCAEAVRIFKNEPVDPEIANDIIASLREVKKDSANDSIDVVSWAVRSSAIGEDSEELSAAGQNETILGCVTPEEVLKAVSSCWASLFAYQSVHYRWQHGLPIISDMAVVVQKMVPAESAGVLFTWHPSSANPSQMVITSNYGLGESVVSGKTDPDTFILNRTYDGTVCLLDQVIGTKEKMLTLTENGVKEVIVGDEQEGSFIIVNGNNNFRERWSLTKDQAIALGKVGVLLEEAFGGPRDIEWAYYKGDLYLLQSRPITTLNTWTEFELSHELDSAVTTENSLFTMANTGEVFPIATSALTRTHPVVAIDRGVQINVNSVYDPFFTKTLFCFHHRVMIDVILSIHLNSRHEEIQMSSKILDLAIFGHPVINEQINSMVFDRWGPLPFMAVGKMFFKQFTRARNVKWYVKKSERFTHKLDIGIKDGDSLKEMYDKIVSNHDALDVPGFYHAATTAGSVLWQILCMTILIGKNKDLKTEHYADFANILSSCDDVVSAQVPMYLEKIAKLIKDEGYTEEFCTIKAEFGVDWMKTKCPAAYRVFDEFLLNHGHRCLGEFELMEETWGFNPSLVIPMIQANTKHMRESVKEHKTIDQVIDMLSTPVNFVTRNILKYVMSNLRVAVGKREQSKSAVILALDKVRKAYKSLAKEMVKQGVMPSEDLIFHFTSYELGEVVSKRNPLLINKAMKRQRLYPRWNKLKFPELIHGFPEPEKEMDTPIDLVAGTKCTGTPVCTGSAQARACVITSLDDIGQLEKGDILITYCTDIGWSPYFPMLSGIVTELGGLVSHGAVVAREYGLPCIVGVKNVTKLFQTGDIVHLSGLTGELGKI